MISTSSLQPTTCMLTFHRPRSPIQNMCRSLWIAHRRKAYATLSQSCLHLVPCLSSSTRTPGTILWWDGNPWRALNLGETTVTLLSSENHLVDVPIAVFDALITQRKVTIATASRDDEARSAEAHERLTKASPKHLEIATQRYKLLGRALPEGEEATVAPRTLQRWQAQFRTAEVVHGHGFTGLIPRWSNSGNRLPRLSQSTEQLLEKYITDHYETLQQRSKHAVYLLLEREAKEHNIPVPSYRTISHARQRAPTLSTNPETSRPPSCGSARILGVGVRADNPAAWRSSLGNGPSGSHRVGH
jgi:putative transposase